MRLAIMAHDGLARAVLPAHAPLDGDTIFAAATGLRPMNDPVVELTELGHVATQVMARAIARGVYEATRIAGAGCAAVVARPVRDIGLMPSLRAVLPAAAAASVVLLAGILYCLGYREQDLCSGRGLGGRAVPHAIPRHARGDGGGGMPSAGVRCLCAGSVRRVRARARLFAGLAVACGAADHHGVGQRARAWPGAAVPGRAGLPAGRARLATDHADHSRRRIQRHDVRAGTGQRRSAGVRDGDARGQIAHDAATRCRCSRAC